METVELTGHIRASCRRAVWHIAVLAVIVAALKPAAQPSVLVVRPEGSQFRDVVQGMADDLGADMVINEAILDRSTRSIDRALRRYGPSAVVLLDNSAVTRYRAWLGGSPDSLRSPPAAIALMGIQVGDAIAGLPNTEAISYEIPIVTSAVHLRSILKRPVRKVGVVHRQLMSDLIDQNRASCLRENIFIISRVIPDKSIVMRSHVRRALSELLEKEQVDALWVPNDNILLSPTLLAAAWIPQVKRRRIPVIVGIEALAAPELDFGTLAVLPDHFGLGVQAASMIMTARETKWMIRSGAVEPSLSVVKVLNFRQAGTCFGVSKDRCASIDKLLK